MLSKFRQFDPASSCSLASALVDAQASGADIGVQHPLRRIFDSGAIQLLAPAPTSVSALKLKPTTKFNKSLAALLLQHGTFDAKDPPKAYLLSLALELTKAVTFPLPSTPDATDGGAKATKTPHTLAEFATALSIHPNWYDTASFLLDKFSLSG